MGWEEDGIDDWAIELRYVLSRLIIDFLTWIGIACIGYGFSKSFVSAVAWQVFGGAMSSNVGITRCVVAELNPEKR
jgi:hypothetical protein